MRLGEKRSGGKIEAENLPGKRKRNDRVRCAREATRQKKGGKEKEKERETVFGPCSTFPPR